VGGTTGTGGATATGGATGTGGMTATGGSTGNDGSTDAPADTSTTDTSTSDGGLNLATLCPAAPNMRTATSPSMTAAQYCAIYLATCTGANMPDGGLTTEQSCETAFNNLMAEATRECRSDHVCNAAVYFTAAVALHCGHSVGVGLCQDVPADGGGQ
jgi:hypothetical protein